MGVGPGARMISGLFTVLSSCAVVASSVGAASLAAGVEAHDTASWSAAPYSQARAARSPATMAMLRFLSRRLVAQRLLALGVVLTLAFSIGVMASGPIYTDAAREFIVTSSIATATAPTKNIRVDTYWDHSFSWTRADQMVAAAAADAGVPVDEIVRQGEATARVGPQQASVPILFRDGGQDHLAFRSGAAPGPDEVAITVGLAYSSGLHVGDRLDVLGPTDRRAGLRISGIFTPPTDASDPFWF